MTQITHPAVTKYDLALLFTLIVLIDDRMMNTETSVAQKIHRLAGGATPPPATTKKI